MAGKKKCVVVYTEGETEYEFYDSLLNHEKAKHKLKKFNADRILKKCLKGITKFDKKFINKFQTEIVSQYSDHDIVVFLCYDLDVFECGSKPPVDWEKVESKLLKLGASRVYHVKAKHCIEDVFLSDIPGICKFLNIEQPKRIIGSNGVDKMNYLFEKGNRIYQKGFKCGNFISNLNMDIIINNNYELFEELINELIK